MPRSGGEGRYHNNAAPIRRDPEKDRLRQLQTESSLSRAAVTAIVAAALGLGYGVYEGAQHIGDEIRSGLQVPDDDNDDDALAHR